MSVKDFIAEQPRSRLIAGALIVTGLLTIILINPYGQNYYQAVQRELPLAMAICENAEEWVMSDRKRLKMRNNELDHILVNGEKVELNYIKYPRAIIFDSGYRHPGAKIKIFCTFKDPRTKENYYYDYLSHQWVDKVLSRR